MILMCCAGCGKETTNHNRYDFTNAETVNNFLKDSLTIKKHESFSKPYSYLLTIYNNSDYYINNISLKCIYDGDESYARDLPQTIAIRPNCEAKIILPVRNSKKIDWDLVYFTLGKDNSKPINEMITLEENPLIVYSTDLSVSAKFSALLHMDVTFENNTTKAITLNGKYLCFYDDIGFHTNLGVENTNNSEDYYFDIPENDKVTFNIKMPALININEETGVLFSGGEETTV